jgi:hypothetical protein
MLPVPFIEKLKEKKFFQLFTVYTRFLIGSAFVIAAFGMKKVTGSSHDLSQTPVPTNKIGLLFYALANTGFYWKFIGYAQVVAGLLLMTQKLARLGAVIFFPIVLNIFVITVSLQFMGTPIITGLMLLATVYLLLWDLKVLQYIIVTPPTAKIEIVNHPDPTHQPFWIITGGLLFVTIIVLALLKVSIALILLACFGEGAVAFCLYLFRTFKLKRSL